MMHYNDYNREERAICAHLFRLLLVTYSGLKPATHSGVKSATYSGLNPASDSGVK